MRNDGKHRVWMLSEGTIYIRPKRKWGILLEPCKFKWAYIFTVYFFVYVLICSRDQLMTMLRERPGVRLFETWVELTNKQRSGLKGDTRPEIMWVSQSPLESLNEHWRMCLSCRRSGWHANNYGLFPPSLTKVIKCKVQSILFLAHSMQVSPKDVYFSEVTSTSRDILHKRRLPKISSPDSELFLPKPVIWHSNLAWL